MIKLNKRITILTSIILLISILIMPIKVYAAGSFSINKSSASVTTGGTTTITVTASNCAGRFNVSSSNTSVATVSTSSIWLDNSSSIITITAKAAGTANITITAVDVTDTEINDVTGTRTCSITVSNPQPVTPPPQTTTKPSNNNSGGGNNSSTTKPSTNTSKPSNNTTTTTKPEEKKSNDATLKSLIVEGYELYPVFDANNKEYNVKVANDITKVAIIPTVNHEKASYKLEGVPEELQVGKNVINIIVTAEDGTTSKYILNVTREREGLNVQSIKVFYTDEIGNKKELALNPIFNSEVFEYISENVSHVVSKLDVEVLANLEKAKIEVTGNELLNEGENTITLTVTMPSESEEVEDEVLKYEITVNKEKEPVVTLMGRIKNWFNGITGTVSTWFEKNLYEVLMGALALCSFALGGLSVYLVLAYKKYKLILERIAELTRINNTAAAKVNENLSLGQQTQESTENILANEKETKPKGRHF